MLLRLSEIAAATGGTLVGDDCVVDGVSIDSRDLASGSLFVPIVAARDGHDFIADARAGGAAAHLAGRRAGPEPYVLVGETTEALQRLANACRRARDPAVVGITGSVGKTTTKDLLRAALAPCRRVHASTRSFNNELGVPLTLLQAPDDAEVVVTEMGARGIGHIALLCSIAEPSVGVVLAVGAAHTELLGDLDGVALAKGEMVESLAPSGHAVLNADDPRVIAMRSRTVATVLTYGSAGEVRARDLSVDAELRPRFTVDSPWGHAEVRLSSAGVHTVGNALAAIAAAMVVGGDLEAVAAGLADADVSPWRMEVARTPSGATVVNDAYNANPMSMHAAIDALLASAGDTAHRCARRDGGARRHPWRRPPRGRRSVAIRGHRARGGRNDRLRRRRRRRRGRCAGDDGCRPRWVPRRRCWSRGAGSQDSKFSQNDC